MPSVAAGVVKRYRKSSLFFFLHGFLDLIFCSHHDNIIKKNTPKPGCVLHLSFSAKSFLLSIGEDED